MKKKSLGTSSPSCLFKNKMRMAFDASDEDEFTSHKAKRAKRISKTNKKKSSDSD